MSARDDYPPLQLDAGIVELEDTIFYRMCEEIDMLRAQVDEQGVALEQCLALIRAANAARTIPVLPRGNPSPRQLYDEDRDEFYELHDGQWQMILPEPVEKREFLGQVVWKGPSADYWANAAEINKKLAEEAAAMFRATGNGDRALEIEQKQQKEEK